MKPVVVTLEFDTLEEARHAIDKLCEGLSYADLPDVGAAPPATRPPPPPLDLMTQAKMVFGAAPPPPAFGAGGTVGAGGSTSTTGLPAAPQAPVAPERDATGLPWDGRIHTSTKVRNADGAWRQKRGVNDAELVARVEAELRSGLSAPVAPPLPPVASTVAPVAPPSLPAVPPAPPVLPFPPVTAPLSFASFMLRLGPLVVAGKISNAAVLGVLAEVELTTVAQLATRPDLLEYVSARVDQLLQ